MIVKVRFQRGVLFAAIVMVGAAGVVSLQAKPKTDQSTKAEKARASEAAADSPATAEIPDVRGQKVDEIGRNWVDQIQGRNPATSGAHDNGERIGPVDPEASDETSGSLRLQNPGQPETGETDNEGARANVAAAAEETRTTGVIPRDEGPGLISVIFRFFGLMALMVGLFYFGLRYLRAKTGAPVMGGGDLVQVLVSTPLVQGKFLQIVDVAGRLMVLGVSESGVQMLESIDDGVVADRIRIWQSRRAASGPIPTSLLDQLQKVFKTSDFRFWVSSEDRAKKGPGFASFGELLSGQIPASNRGAFTSGDDDSLDSEVTENVTRTAGGGARKSRAETADLFSDSPEAGTDEVSLKNLLKQQKRRLAAIKSRSPQAEI